MPRYKETSFSEIIEGCEKRNDLSPAEIEELSEQHCRLARAGATFTRNDRWNDLLEAPEETPYSHFAQPPDWYVPPNESLPAALERMDRESALAEKAAKAAKDAA